MPITSMDRYFVGNPNIVGVVTTDNFATITAQYYFLVQAPYVNQIQNGEFEFSPTDIILIFFNGGIGFFTYDAVNQTFLPGGNGGDVILPVTVGHFASFYNLEGTISDQGFLPSNAALTTVSMVDKSIAPVVGDIAQFKDTAGTIIDSGISSASLVTLKSPPAVVNYIAKFFDTNGNIMATAGPAINNGTIQSGVSGNRGGIIIYPDTANTGTFQVTATANAGAFSVSLTNAAFGQGTIVTLPDPANANARVLVAATNTPFVTGHIPEANGTSGLMTDSGIAAGNIVLKNTAPRLSVSQLAITAQSIPNGVYTEVVLNDVDFDTASGFAANAYTVQTTGYYYISYQVILDIDPLDTVVLPTCSIYVNNVDTQVLATNGYVTFSGDFACVQNNGILPLTAADVVTLKVYQATGGARPINSGGAVGNTFICLSLLP